MMERIKTFFRKIIDSNPIYYSILLIFFLSIGFTLAHRGGKDLKVGLYGVEQAFHTKGSLYFNPTDPSRAIFRYAPGVVILEYPFLLKSKMS